MVQLIQGINWVTPRKIKRYKHWTTSNGDISYDIKDKRIYNNTMYLLQMAHSAK